MLPVPPARVPHPPAAHVSLQPRSLFRVRGDARLKKEEVSLAWEKRGVNGGGRRRDNMRQRR